MDKKRSALKWFVPVLIIASVGAVCILIGQNLAVSKYQSEKELNYRINRSDL